MGRIPSSPAKGEQRNTGITPEALHTTTHESIHRKSSPRVDHKDESFDLDTCCSDIQT